MDLLHRLAPPHAVLAPALWAIAFYGVRYVVMAGLPSSTPSDASC